MNFVGTSYSSLIPNEKQKTLFFLRMSGSINNVIDNDTSIDSDSSLEESSTWDQEQYEGFFRDQVYKKQTEIAPIKSVIISNICNVNERQIKSMLLSLLKKRGYQEDVVKIQFDFLFPPIQNLDGVCKMKNIINHALAFKMVGEFTIFRYHISPMVHYGVYGVFQYLDRPSNDYTDIYFALQGYQCGMNFAKAAKHVQFGIKGTIKFQDVIFKMDHFYINPFESSDRNVIFKIQLKKHQLQETDRNFEYNIQYSVYCTTKNDHDLYITSLLPVTIRQLQ